MLKRWGIRLGAAGLLLAGGMVGTSLFVEDQVAGQGAQFDARTLTSIATIINASGLATWPKFASDPVTCNAANEGAYYFNTGTSQFRTCNGSAWSDGGGGAGQLTDLSDVFISAPANNEVLRYDGVTDNRWENSTASASALNDLSDVFAPTPSDGDIIVWDGVTDNRWESVAGASPSALSGLSDVTITTPARLNGFYHNGTTWVNAVVKARFWAFPFDSWSGGGLTVNGSSQTIIATDNAVRVWAVHFAQPIEVDKIVFVNGTLTGIGCDDFYGIGLYSINGNTKIVDSGAFTATGADTANSIDITNVFVNPGDYWLAVTSDDTTCEWFAFNDNEVTVVDFEDFMNTGATMVGTATNPGSNGALPATLGTLTSNNADIDLPWIKFIGTDP